MSITANIDLQKNFIQAHLKKPLVMIGLMGAGKSRIGKMLASELGYKFIDSDEEIVRRDGRTIPEIFGSNNVNESEFRQIERDTIQDIMKDTQPHVIGTGGGAFMNDETRATIKKLGTSIFLRASLDVLAKRVGDGAGRPLLKDNPRQKLYELMQVRYPIYAEADIIVETKDQPREQTRNDVIQALYNHLKPQ